MALLFAEYNIDSFCYYALVTALAGTLLFGFLELAGRGLRYSKFAIRKNPLGEIPSKIAMFLYYAPSAALAAISWFSENERPNRRLRFATAAIFIHFFKRVLEVLFVHKYSGNAEALSSLIIVSFYTAATASILHAQRVSAALPPPSTDLLLLGCAFFAIGIAGNFYHHYLLARLRSTSWNSRSSQPRYVIPRGGLFDLVACPHYLFEIIDFVGLAMISQTSLSAIVALFVGVYLVSRSIATRRWYREKIDGYPEDRKAILPFVL